MGEPGEGLGKQTCYIIHHSPDNGAAACLNVQRWTPVMECHNGGTSNGAGGEVRVCQLRCELMKALNQYAELKWHWWICWFILTAGAASCFLQPNPLGETMQS